LLFVCMLPWRLLGQYGVSNPPMAASRGFWSSSGHAALGDSVCIAPAHRHGHRNGHQWRGIHFLPPLFSLAIIIITKRPCYGPLILLASYIIVNYYVISSVVYHPNTGRLAGIGMVLALVGWLSGWYFLYCRIWRELFFEVSGYSFFEKNCGKPFFPQKRGAEFSKRGPQPPFLEGKRGSRQKFPTEMYQPRFPLVSAW
jgi:hypothetical protein